jgi:hypothetical protein
MIVTIETAVSVFWDVMLFKSVENSQHPGRTAATVFRTED